MHEVSFRACRAIAVALFFALSTTVLSAAEIFYLDQTRAVQASAFAGDSTGDTADADDAFASDFEAFASMVNADALLPFAYAHGDAVQFSSLGDLFISTIGAANAVHSWDLIDDGLAVAAAGSSFSVTFELNETVNYAIAADLSVLQTVAGTAAGVILIGPGGVVYSDFLDTAGVSSNATGGVLEPGQYTLAASASANSGGGNPGSTRSSFFVNFAIPEPHSAGMLLAGALLLFSSRRRPIAR